jgi:hypothetical protein
VAPPSTARDASGSISGLLLALIGWAGEGKTYGTGYMPAHC